MPTVRHTVPSQLLDAALRRAPAAPLLTAYDDARDERVELSATTFGNWVAKSANLLQEEFDVAPGSTVAVALPVHWQTAAVLLAVWSCGATVLDTAAEDDGRLAGADVVLADVDRLPALEEALGDDGPPLLGLSLHPMGLGLRDYTGAARDFAIEVRGAADVFVPWQPVDPAATGLVAGGLELYAGRPGGHRAGARRPAGHHRGGPGARRRARRDAGRPGGVAARPAGRRRLRRPLPGRPARPPAPSGRPRSGSRLRSAR